MKNKKEHEKLARELFGKASSLEEFIYKHSKTFNTLTKREVDVLTLVANGLSSGLIAQNLKIRKKSVQNHRTSINNKLSINSQTDYIKFALAFGLISF